MVDINLMYLDMIRDRQVEIEQLAKDSLSVKRLMVVIESMNELIDDVNGLPGKGESTDGTVIKGERTLIKFSLKDLIRLGYLDYALSMGYLDDMYISISSFDNKFKKMIEEDIKINKKSNTTSYITTDTNHRKMLEIIKRAKEEYE